MALPGLDTDEIEWIAYWNFLDNGASDITPDDATSAMVGSRRYANGVEGTVEVTWAQQDWKSPRQIPCRVKSDGWIIAWLPQTPATEATRTLNIEGPYDIHNDWTSNGGLNFNQHQLERVVNTLYNALSNSGDATYSSGDVSLHNYHWEQGTTFTFAYGGPSNSWTMTADAGMNNLYAGWLATLSNATGGVAPNVNWAVNQENVTMSTENFQENLGARNIVGRTELTIGETVTITGNSDDVGKCSFYIIWD